MLNESIGKQLLAATGVAIPRGDVVSDAEGARRVAAELAGPVVVKAQVPVGGRGKAGGVLHAADPHSCAEAARRLLGVDLGEHRIEEVLVEDEVSAAAERYMAVLDDPSTRGPMVLLSARGGVDIEKITRTHPHEIVRHPFDIRSGVPHAQALALADAAGFEHDESRQAAEVLEALIGLYRQVDAELIEINPLARDRKGRLWALDAKVSLDPSGLDRHSELSGSVSHCATRGTELERRAQAQGMLFIELDGPVGVLANGAGLTMATLDAIDHFGGRAANFLEIGGQNYSRAEAALELVLANRRVRSVLVNFCGAFARTDVMTEGVVRAMRVLKPHVPFFFSIHGTGEDEAIALVRRYLDTEPYARMDDAVRAAVGAAGAGAGDCEWRPHPGGGDR